MAQTLKINNFGPNNVTGATELRGQVNAGDQSVQVDASADAGNGAFAILGVLGADTSELVVINSRLDTTHVQLQAPAGLPHSFGEPLTYLFGNEINIYRAPNVDGTQPGDDQFAVVATVNIDPNSALTQYIDPDGGGGYWYKATFANSTTQAESSLAYAKARRGDLNQHFVSLAQIRQEAGFRNSPYVTDDLIDEKRQIAEAEVTSALTGVYMLPLPTPTNPNVMNAALQIAAGLLMSSQYGNMNPSMAAQGDAKAAEGRATLELISTRLLILDDADFNDTGLADNPNSPDIHFGPDTPYMPRNGEPHDGHMFSTEMRY